MALLSLTACHTGSYGRTTAYKSSIKNLRRFNKQWVYLTADKVKYYSKRVVLGDPRKSCTHHLHGVWAHEQSTKKLGIFIPPMKDPASQMGHGN